MITAEKLTKYYGDHVAIRDISFEIGKGEVVGLLGLNGAGKTTTLRALSGLLVPTSGQITIDGTDMASQPDALRSRIGFLPERSPVYDEMTVVAYLLFVGRIKGLSGNTLATALEEALAATDLTRVGNHPIGALSHGFRRRVGIAQAVIHRPTLILLDEPTSGLDPVQVVHMRDLIRNLRTRHTVIVSSHILSEIHQVCDRILVLQNGEIVGEGSEEELAQKMGQHTTLQIEASAESETLVRVFEQFKEVVKFKIDSTQGAITRATVELDNDCRESLAKALIETGAGLRRLEQTNLELENIFLRLTGSSDSPREESP